MPGDHSKDPDQTDARPEVAKDDPGAPREKIKEKWTNPTETMGDAPAGSPNAEEQSRKN